MSMVKKPLQSRNLNLNSNYEATPVRKIVKDSGQNARLQNLNGRLKYYINLVRQKHPEEMDKVKNEYEVKMKDLQGQINALQDEISELNSLNVLQEKELKEKNASLRQKDDLMNKQEQFTEGLEQSIADLQVANKVLTNKERDLKAKVSALKEDYDELCEANEALEKLRVKLEENMKKAADNAAEQKKLHAIEMKLSHDQFAEKERLASEKHSNEMREMSEEFFEKERNLKNELKQAERQVEKIKIESEKATTEILGKAVSDFNGKFEQKENELKEVTHKLNKLADSKKTLEDENAKLLQKIKDLELNSEDLYKKLTKVETKLENKTRKYHDSSQTILEQLDIYNNLLLEEEKRIEGLPKFSEASSSRFFHESPQFSSAVAAPLEDDDKYKRPRESDDENSEETEYHEKRQNTVETQLQSEIVSSTGSIVLEEIDATGAFIRIFNNSKHPVCLSGWNILVKNPSGEIGQFCFPDDFTLAASGKVSVTSPSFNDNDDDTEVHLQWNEPSIWSSDGCTIQLFDMNGIIASTGKVEEVEVGVDLSTSIWGLFSSFLG